MKYKKVKYNKKINLNWKKILFWTPKILTILYIIFITIFAFDESVISLPFIVHLFPTIILTLILVLTWKRPITGGIIFLILGVLFAIFLNAIKTLLTFFLISFPPILIGVLLLLSRIIKKK